MENRGKIVVCGVGKSGHIGEKIAATLTSTGSPAVVLNSLNALHGDLGVVSDGDVVLALSYSGETDELVNILPALARFDVKIVAMTGNPKSFLAQHSHVHLDVERRAGGVSAESRADLSTTVMLVLGDALAMVLLEARGFTKDDFARFHPGGRLGRTLLLKVRQIMRGAGSDGARARRRMTVREVLHAMAKARAGAAVIVDEAGRLAGHFHARRFRRGISRRIRICWRRPVSEFMTRQPDHHPRATSWRWKCCTILEQHRIDDLVVVDEEQPPIGVVDSQDLARFKLV